MRRLTIPLKKAIQQALQRTGLALTVLSVALLAVSPALAQEMYPSTIPLPDGFRPEGIAVGRGPVFYTGSIPTGAIYRGSLRTGEGEILVPAQEGRAAIGMDYDRRSGYLFVAGGPTGKAFVYDGESGSLAADFTFTAPESTFINDVIVTRQAAYFTNSFQPFLYRVALGPGGRVPVSGEFETLALGGDFTQVEGFSANGIAASPNGKWLIVVHSTLGVLYRVDPNTGYARQIDLGGATVQAGDGLLLLGSRLYVVQNQLNQIAVVELERDYLSGELVETITSSAFRIPTTIARFGRYLYAVNARFDTPPTPETEYEVVQVPR